MWQYRRGEQMAPDEEMTQYLRRTRSRPLLQVTRDFSPISCALTGHIYREKLEEFKICCDLQCPHDKRHGEEALQQDRNGKGNTEGL